MKSLLTFELSESQSIQIFIDEQNKTNVYGYETAGLHVFDEIEVQYIHGDQVVVLAQDSVGEVLTVFAAALEKVVKNQLPLDNSFTVGEVSYYLSYKTMHEDQSEKKEDVFSQYWVWSMPGEAQTWLYNRDNTIYLEISSIYPRLFSDSPQDCISFSEYATSYKPIVIIELHKERVQSCIHQCRALLETIEKVS